MIVYALAEELNLPHAKDFMSKAGYDYKAHYAAEQAYVERVVEFAKSFEPHPLAGEIVSTPMGDGAAEYVITKIRGRVALFHLAVGDAWTDGRFERTATVAELRRMVTQRSRMQRIFGARQDA